MTRGPVDTASAYCRQARRLRALLANQPARLHRELSRLALRRDARVASPAPVDVPSRAQAFADSVASSFEGPVLRYSQRRDLMQRARRIGIGEFEANLVIAAVQHERRKLPAAPTLTTRAADRIWRLPNLAPLLVVLAVESLVGLGIWKVCFG